MRGYIEDVSWYSAKSCLTPNICAELSREHSIGGALMLAATVDDAELVELLLAAGAEATTRVYSLLSL